MPEWTDYDEGRQANDAWSSWVDVHEGDLPRVADSLDALATRPIGG